MDMTADIVVSVDGNLTVALDLPESDFQGWVDDLFPQDPEDVRSAWSRVRSLTFTSHCEMDRTAMERNVDHLLGRLRDTTHSVQYRSWLKVREMYMRQCHLSDHAARSVAQAIAALPLSHTLVKLAMSDSSISARGIQSIVTAIEHFNFSLQSVDLSYDHSPVASAASKCKAPLLERLDLLLQRNRTLRQRWNQLCKSEPETETTAEPFARLPSCVPEVFCPLEQGNVMQDPVTLVDGYTYERTALRKHFQSQQRQSQQQSGSGSSSSRVMVSPLTGERLGNSSLSLAGVTVTDGTMKREQQEEQEGGDGSSFPTGAMPPSVQQEEEMLTPDALLNKFLQVYRSERSASLTFSHHSHHNHEEVAADSASNNAAPAGGLMWHDNDDAQKALQCPITGDLMVYPVIAVDGHTYEREAIEEWFQQFTTLARRHQLPRSPVTNEIVPSLDLIPNHAVQSLSRAQFRQVYRSERSASLTFSHHSQNHTNHEEVSFVAADSASKHAAPAGGLVWHDNDDAPKALQCPITEDFMMDPVIAKDGHTYEREAIEEWLQQFTTLARRHQLPRSPVTNEILPSLGLIPNHAMRSQCRAFQRVRPSITTGVQEGRNDE